MAVHRHERRIFHHIGGGGTVGRIYGSRVLLSFLVARCVNNRDHTVTISIVAMVV